MMVSGAFRRTLVDFARERLPHEACGLISAPLSASAAERDTQGLYRLHKAENASEEPETSFLIDPDEQRALLQALWARDEEVVGIVHSHPHGTAWPSERDRAIAAAQPEPLVWAIIGPADSMTPGLWVGELP